MESKLDDRDGYAGTAESTDMRLSGTNRAELHVAAVADGADCLDDLGGLYKLTWTSTM
jgi:hypothetical protein